VIDRESHSFPFGATLVCVTARMEEPLAASLRRVAGAGHTVYVLSLAQEEFEADLGSILVANVLNAMRAIEARDTSLDERPTVLREEAYAEARHEPINRAAEAPVERAPETQAPESPFARPRTRPPEDAGRV
jgi:hypothetical protein